ncbi:hypothetical protein [Nostoc sp. CCY0012]|uniref:hypothetical protein n=1 Tax=Nostoc sp. CCY0012 TaxID=1056123 RepID=UPI0039C726DC
MQLLDLTFSNYSWYRRLRGKTWWQVEIPLFDGNNTVWVNHTPECDCYIIKTEKY